MIRDRGSRVNGDGSPVTVDDPIPRSTTDRRTPRIRAHLDRDLAHAGERQDALPRRALELRLHRAGRRREDDPERDAIALDRDVADEAEVDDAAPEVRIDDRALLFHH